MIRFILKIHRGEDYAGPWSETTYTTLDIDVPALEAFLRSGGSGENSFLITSLVGVSLIEPAVYDSGAMGGRG